MKSVEGYLLLILASCQSLLGVIRIEEATNPPSCRPPKYTIYDVGATSLDYRLLNPYALPHTFAPRVNNARQISANREEEGYFRDFNYGELIPQIGYCLRGHAYGLNDEGDIISTLVRNRDNVDWFIWTQKNLRKEKRYFVQQPDDDLKGADIDLRGINNQKWAVGNINPGCVLRPVVWNPCLGLKPLGHYLGWDFKGRAFGINQKGTVVGFVSECDEDPPFAWNQQGGLEILRSFKTAFTIQSCHEIHGPVRFADIVITDDNYVYGTLWIDNDYYHDDGKIPYYAYRWEPYNRDFRYLDLQGMRLNAVNKSHTLVGAIEGQAAMREKGRKPLLLKTFLPNGEWELLEATDINDHGDIVGYGKYQGVTHIFFMKRE